jgi:hypothetical protein
MYCFDLAFKGHTAILTISLVFGTMIGAMVLARMQLARVTLARVTLARIIITSDTC